MKLKSIFIIFFAIILGTVLGQYMFKEYKEKTIEVSCNKEKLFFLQQGVYKTKESMEKNTKYLPNYFYIKEKDLYKVFAAITKSDENKDKLKGIYENLGNDIYVKEEYINNKDFLKLLFKYDENLKETEKKDEIIDISNKIINLYKELVITE